MTTTSHEEEDGENISNTHVKIKIKHIVLSGGGGTGFAYYGALRESHKDGFWNINDIETMHAVSCGSVFAFLMAVLKHIDWEDYNDYCIKRPWETVFGFSAEKILNAYSNVGICGRDAIEMIVSPILSAVDLPLNITLLQFYEFTQIEMYFYTTNLDEYKLIGLSYKTHPEWTLVDAIYSSCALPLLFRPSRVNGKVYIDGGFLCNYPLKQCIEQVENTNEIFGMNKISIHKQTKDECGQNISSNEYGNIIDYLLDIIQKTGKKLINENKTTHKYTLEISDTATSAWEVYEALKTKETRHAKIEYGAESWREYRKKIGFIPVYERQVQTHEKT